jgi:hypothetical protein
MNHASLTHSVGRTDELLLGRREATPRNDNMHPTPPPAPPYPQAELSVFGEGARHCVLEGGVVLDDLVGGGWGVDEGRGGGRG